jgi:hypothetical protein
MVFLTSALEGLYLRRNDMLCKATREPPWRVLLVGIGCVVLLCCNSREGHNSEAPSTVDSAGIQIVRNPSNLRHSAERWMLTSNPLFEIPGVNAVGDTLFYAVRGSTVRLPGNGVLVAETVFDDVRALLSDDSLEVLFARSTAVERLVPYIADSFVVSHTRAGASIVDERFQIGRTLKLAVTEEDIGQPGLRVVMGAFNDGTVMAYGRAGPRNPFETKVLRPTFFLVRYSADGSFLNAVGTFLGREGLQIYDDAVKHFGFPLPFPIESFWAASGDVVYVGHNDRYEIAAYRNDGTLKRLVRRAWDPLPISGEDFAAYRQRVMTEMRTRMDSSLRAFVIDEFVELPHHKPSFDTLTVDRGGRLWVREHRPFGENNDSWTVFDTTGFVVTEVEVPRGLFITEIGDDYVVGIKGGFWDVETAVLRVYGLNKTSGG